MREASLVERTGSAAMAISGEQVEDLGGELVNEVHQILAALRAEEVTSSGAGELLALKLRAFADLAAALAETA